LRSAREIGIRMALGAGSADVLKMVMRHALLMLGIGLTIGTGRLVCGNPADQERPLRRTATDPLTYVGISLLLLSWH